MFKFLLHFFELVGGLEDLLMQVIAETVHVLELCEALASLLCLERFIMMQLSLLIIDVQKGRSATKKEHS